MSSLARTYNAAVVVGRWQLPHHGHASLFRRGLEIADRLIVVIGSSFRSRDTRHPFNASERQTMILAGLAPAERARVTFVPVRDYYDDERWNAAVRHGVLAQVERTDKLCLVGFKKDATSYYLDHFPGWGQELVASSMEIDATSLRNVFLGDATMQSKLAVLAPYVAPEVLNFLQSWSELPAFAAMAKEQQAVLEYRRKWTAPWYMTADALVRCGDHVLLIQRGGDIGHGLWALPGGFVNPGEMFFPAALRELKEETEFYRLTSSMKAALKGSAVYEHPLRSPRGRIVTSTYYFCFAEGPLPEVHHSDDAMDARWVHKSELNTYEDRLFEDHACPLDQFVGLYPEISV